MECSRTLKPRAQKEPSNRCHFGLAALVRQCRLPGPSNNGQPALHL